MSSLPTTMTMEIFHGDGVFDDDNTDGDDDDDDDRRFSLIASLVGPPVVCIITSAL